MTHLFDQGFWKSTIFYRQSVLYYWLLSAWYRSFTWYAAVNPAIPHGGMLDEHKSDIYPLLPAEFLPLTRKYIHDGQHLAFLEAHGFEFPVVIKPDIGLKGIGVDICDDVADLERYLEGKDNCAFIIQSYIDRAKEFSILYYRNLNGSKGISSFIEKKYPVVVGDGQRSLHQLIDGHNHSYLDKNKAKEAHRDRVPTPGEKIVIHRIGNYARGSTFISLQHEADEALLQGIDVCMQDVRDIDFCRLDVKAENMEALKQGKYTIIEVNGGKSEPLHIYDKNTGIFETFGIVHKHWMIYKGIVDYHLAKGYRLMSTAEGVRALRNIKRIVKNKDK
ncbi:MAG: ATP-grasp domain-containing protein [Saprospiraceae bacterium]|nr:ATP-grasp domain-containing protein [Saprospiraceae bacterium]